MNARNRTLIGTATIVVLLALWQLASVATVAGKLSSSPIAVVLAIPDVLHDGLIREGLFSLQAFAVGIVAAIVVGVTLGLFLGSMRVLTYLLEPALMAFYITPTVALLPLAVIWLGVGNTSTAFIVFLSAVFPIAINTIAGIQQSDPAWSRAIRAFGGGRLLTFALADIPGAFPEIILGIRLGIGRGLIGIIVAEMYASSRGLGFLLDTYTRAYRISDLCVVVFAIGLVGFAMVQAVRVFEERTARWRAA
jgi:sulfonate transport system permease protein